MNGANIEAISRCFFPPDHRMRADVALVLGMSDPKRPVDRAIELFRTGMVGRLVFTGGYNRRLDRAEAHEMAKLAAEGGIPADAIIIEDKALNTGENIEFSYRLLEDRLESGDIGSVMLLTIRYHLRRAYIAARRRFPAKVAIGWTCYESRHYTSANWFDVARGRGDVMTEIEKIDRYYGLTIDEVVRQAV